MMPTTIFKTEDIKSKIEKSSMDINGDFIFFQTFTEMLLRMPLSSCDQKDMVEYLRQQYSTCKTNLPQINQFAQDTWPRKAIRWYTKQTIFYQILNLSLRRHDIYTIYQLRWLITELHKELKSLNLSQNKSTDIPKTVYRFQLISLDELEKIRLSIKNHISFNSFMSTSATKNYPKWLQESAIYNLNILKTKRLVAVIVEISIDPTVTNAAKPFACVVSESDFKEEEEWLFMMGSIFEINEVQPQKEHSECWLIRLKLCDENSHSLKDVFDQVKSTMDENTDVFSIGKLLRTMGKYAEAALFYEQVLERTHKTDFLTLAKCHHGLSGTFNSVGDYDKAIDSLKAAMSKYELVPDNNLLLSDCHRNLGVYYHTQKDNNNAYKYMKEALDGYEKFYGKDHPETALMYLNLGAFYSDTGNLNCGLDYSRQALNCFQKLFTTHHRYISLALCNIAVTYCRLKEYDLALKMHKEQLKIQEKTLPADNYEFGVTYLNIGEVHEARQNFDQALDYYEKAKNVFLNASLLSTHGAMIELEEHLHSTNAKKSFL